MVYSSCLFIFVIYYLLPYTHIVGAALFVKPTLLLLDEPTNHCKLIDTYTYIIIYFYTFSKHIISSTYLYLVDLHALVWLENW